jgi:hypothetical protein
MDKEIYFNEVEIIQGTINLIIRKLNINGYKFFSGYYQGAASQNIGVIEYKKKGFNQKKIIFRILIWPKNDEGYNFSVEFDSESEDSEIKNYMISELNKMTTRALNCKEREFIIKDTMIKNSF